MFLPASLVSLIFLDVLFEECSFYKIKISKIWIQAVIVMLLLNNYSYVYLSKPGLDYSKPRIYDGVYNGLRVQDKLDNIVTLQNDILYFSEGRESILADGTLRPVYLMTSLTPFTPSVANLNWDYALKYFEKFNDYPDIIVLMNKSISNEEANKLLTCHYEILGYSTLYAPEDVVIYGKSH